MATVPPSEQREVWDCGIDDSALAALDIDAAIAASARDAEAHVVLSEDEVVELRGELRRAQDRVEELTSLLRLYSPPPATIRRHQRSPASMLQERVPLTASLSTNRSPTVRLKKAWCVAHTGGSQLRDENSRSRTAHSPCTHAATSPAVTTNCSAASSQTSPQGASPNIRVPRTKMLQLHSEFACAICYELYMEPVTTPCGHSYCRCCLANSLQRLGRNCPQCRTRIPAGTVLRPNTALASGAVRLLSSFCCETRSDKSWFSEARCVCLRVCIVPPMRRSDFFAVCGRAGVAARADVLASRHCRR